MESVLKLLQDSLPPEIASFAKQHLLWLETGDFASVFQSAEAQELFDKAQYEGSRSWDQFLLKQIAKFNSDSSTEHSTILFSIGYAALLAFIQANITGPPLPLDTTRSFFRSSVVDNASILANVRQGLLSSLTSDAVAAYPLIRHIELLALAKTILDSSDILNNALICSWARLRVNFIHQKVLSETSSTLQDSIYDDLKMIEQDLFDNTKRREDEFRVEFLLERAVIHLHHDQEKAARADIEQAGSLHHFKYQLTGRLGKRTKFQQNDTSQLVVLAKSADLSAANGVNGHDGASSGNITTYSPQNAKPTAFDLNDDTILERIAFSDPVPDNAESKEENLPAELIDLDPSDQPLLNPLDSIVLLSFASTITNTSPENGLTREEMLPYATRVLDGGSSNWQIYTQALLVRSRIEGYRSRTVERGLLQLQALVDQIIVETGDGQSTTSVEQTSFLPKAKQDESAPVIERLRYIFQLASPSRWSLEAELANRWVQLGGLRSALDIYERLEMWAEAALCFAATEQEDKARNMIRRQLYNPTPHSDESNKEEWTGAERDPPPADAPRLFCILGDFDQSVEMYERAWTISHQRYARAQRSIGRLYFNKRDFSKSADAYTKSLKVNQLNQQSWFALGCTLIELEQYERAAESFSRCVQLDETDAESWSNMAAALLNIVPSSKTSDIDTAQKALGNRINALKAFQRAASLKHDSYRIWQNVLVTAAAVTPPDYNAILSAQKRVLDLRGGTDGEKCIDVEIFERLVQHVVESADRYNSDTPGVARMTVRFVDESVVPLITSSVELWRLVGKLAIWRGKLKTALEAEEKAWRVTTAQPGWDTESESKWVNVVEATVRLCNSYESLGPRELTEGLAAGSGAVIASDWLFKAKSACRSVANRGKSTWEGTKSWDELRRLQDDLKSR